MLTFKICVSLYTAALLTRVDVSNKDSEYYYKGYLESKVEYNYSIFKGCLWNMNDDRLADKNNHANGELPREFFGQFDVNNQGRFLSHLLEIDSDTYNIYTQYLQSSGVDYLSL